MADEIASGMGCPTCWNGGSGIKAMLYARPGQYNYYCRAGHQFNDLQDLKAMNPPSLSLPQKQTQQQGHEVVQLSIPSDLKAELLTKFGTPDRLAQTLSGVLRSLAEAQCFLINEVDIQRIEKETGQKPKTGQEVFGIVWMLNQKIKELQASLGTPATPGAQAAAQAPAGTIVVNVQDFVEKLRGVAHFRSQTVEQVAEQTLKMAIENGWA